MIKNQLPASCLANLSKSRHEIYLDVLVAPYFMKEVDNIFLLFYFFVVKWFIFKINKSKAASITCVLTKAIFKSY